MLTPSPVPRTGYHDAPAPPRLTQGFGIRAMSSIQSLRGVGAALQEAATVAATLASDPMAVIDDAEAMEVYAQGLALLERRPLLLLPSVRNSRDLCVRLSALTVALVRAGMTDTPEASRAGRVSFLSDDIAFARRMNQLSKLDPR